MLACTAESLIISIRQPFDMANLVMLTASLFIFASCIKFVHSVLSVIDWYIGHYLKEAFLWFTALVVTCIFIMYFAHASDKEYIMETVHKLLAIDRLNPNAQKNSPFSMAGPTSQLPAYHGVPAAAAQSPRSLNPASQDTCTTLLCSDAIHSFNAQVT